MRNLVTIEGDEGMVMYRTIHRGQLFRSGNRKNDASVYIKIGTKAVLLVTGEDHSFDQEQMVLPLKPGQRIILETGE